MAGADCVFLSNCVKANFNSDTSEFPYFIVMGKNE